MTDVSQFLDKPLPSNEEAERIVIGSILINNAMYEVVASVLDPKDFYHPINRTLFDAIVQVANNSRVVNSVALEEYWKSQHFDYLGAGIMSHISGLLVGLPPLSERTIKQNVNIIKGHSVARQLIRACNTIIYDTLEGSKPIKEIMEYSETKVLTLSSDINTEDKRVDKPFSSLAEIVPAMRQQFEDYHAGKTTGVPTGMRELDDMLDGGGLQNGGMYLVAAGEKAGKTSLALDWVYHISAIAKRGVSLVSTGEMAKITMAKRIYSAHIGVPYYRFRPGIYDVPGDMTYTKVLQGLTRFGQIPIYISDKLMTMGQIRRHWLRMVEAGHKSNNPVVVGLIDYLQLVTKDGRKLTRTEEVEAVSRDTKLLATELGIPIIAISSINRLGLQDNGTLDVHNLRQSGTLGFDAEAIGFLHNPAYIPGQPYEPKEVTPMNFILARQRNGPTGTIPLMFIGPYMQFMTVKQFEKAKGDGTSDALPKSLGQMQQEKEETEDLWPT